MKQCVKGENNLNNVNPSDIVKVVQKYSSYVSALSRRYYLVGGTSEDLFEEGMIGIIEACKNYNGESLFEDRFEPFVKLCIKRQILDAIKKANTQKNKVLNEAISIVQVDSSGNERELLDINLDRTTSNDPQDMFIEKEVINDYLKKCERKLSSFEKQVFERYFAGEKQAEIANHLGKDVKSIDNTIQRIKSKLK